MAKYEWETPGEWLQQKIMLEEDIVQLRSIALLLTEELTDDEIQDIFQGEMSRDGYFEPLAQEDEA